MQSLEPKVECKPTEMCIVTRVGSFVLYGVICAGEIATSVHRGACAVTHMTHRPVGDAMHLSGIIRGVRCLRNEHISSFSSVVGCLVQIALNIYEKRLASPPM